MKKIENLAAFVFIATVVVLTFLSVLGIWDVFNDDVIIKSFQTLGLLAFVSIVVMISGKFIEKKAQQSTEELIVIPNPIFGSIRRITLIILVVFVSILAILGVLAIWEVIKDEDVLYKSMSSVGILAFGAFLITITSLFREGRNFTKKIGTGNHLWMIILIIFVLLYFFRFFLRF